MIPHLPPRIVDKEDLPRERLSEQQRPARVEAAAAAVGPSEPPEAAFPAGLEEEEEQADAAGKNEVVRPLVMGSFAAAPRSRQRRRR